MSEQAFQSVFSFAPISGIWIKANHFHRWIQTWIRFLAMKDCKRNLFRISEAAFTNFKIPIVFISCTIQVKLYVKVTFIPMSFSPHVFTKNESRIFKGSFNDWLILLQDMVQENTYFSSQWGGQKKGKIMSTVVVVQEFFINCIFWKILYNYIKTIPVKAE